MNLLLTPLLAFGMLTIPDTFQKQEDSPLVIQICDNQTRNKDEIIQDFLELQSSLLVPTDSNKLSPTAQKTGFLAIKMSPEYLEQKLAEKKGKIICAYVAEELMGYILLSEISAFTSLYCDSRYGSFDCKIDLNALEEVFTSDDIGYIEQIAIKPGYSKKGIGTALVNFCKKLSPNGIISDVFVDPWINQASLTFFRRCGFLEIGTLHQTGQKGFIPHETSVFFWFPERQ